MNALEDESRLIVEACQGSMAAFEALVMYYEPRIRRMLYGLTHDVQLTQDLCQETFFAAYRAMPHLKGEELHFAPWLYRIALNQVRSEWRRHKHIAWLSFSAPAEEEEPFSAPTEATMASEERFEERVIERDSIQRVLAQLPATSSACLLLDAEGFTYAEIAETLQTSLSAVRSRLARARQAFQQAYNRLDREGQS